MERVGRVEAPSDDWSPSVSSASPLDEIGNASGEAVRALSDKISMLHLQISTS